MTPPKWEPLFLRMALRQAKSEREKDLLTKTAERAFMQGALHERQRVAELFTDLGLVVRDQLNKGE